MRCSKYYENTIRYVEHRIHNELLLYYSKGYMLDYKYNIWLLDFRYLNIIYQYDLST